MLGTSAIADFRPEAASPEPASLAQNTTLIGHPHPLKNRSAEQTRREPEFPLHMKGKQVRRPACGGRALFRFALPSHRCAPSRRLRRDDR